MHKHWDMGHRAWLRVITGAICAAIGFHSFGSAAGNAATPHASSTNVPPSIATNGLRSFAPPKQVNYREPARIYTCTNLLGWTVFIESELSTNATELTRKAAERLSAKLDGLQRLLPLHTRQVLQKIPLFLLIGEESVHGGRDNGAEYFQHCAPDFWDWTDPRWAGGLVIYSARNYLYLDEQWATRVLVHEFAHAWHLEQWPEKQPDILAAWQNAVTNKLYCKVKALDGTIIDSGYASVNQLEYFAELSCSYFWRGEYEPFDRASLRDHDPTGFAMLEKMWGIHTPPPSPQPSE